MRISNFFMNFLFNLRGNRRLEVEKRKNSVFFDSQQFIKSFSLGEFKEKEGSRVFFFYFFQLSQFFIRYGLGRRSFSFLCNFFFLIQKSCIVSHFNSLGFEQLFLRFFLEKRRLFSLRAFKRAGVTFSVPFLLSEERSNRRLLRSLMIISRQYQKGSFVVLSFFYEFVSYILSRGSLFSKVVELEDRSLDNRMFANLYSRKKRKRRRRFF